MSAFLSSKIKSRCDWQIEYLDINNGPELKPMHYACGSEVYRLCHTYNDVAVCRKRKERNDDIVKVVFT